MDTRNKYIKEVRPKSMEVVAVRRMISKQQTDTQEMKNNKSMENFLNNSLGKSRELGLESNSNRNSSMFKSAESEKAIRDLKDKQKIMIYDLENVGIPEHLRDSNSEDFLGITEFAMKETTWDSTKKQLIETAPAEAFAIKLDDYSYNKIDKALNLLEENPNAYYGMTKDMKRSLKDIANYDDSAVFGKTTKYGITYNTVVSQGTGVQGIGPMSFNKNTVPRMRKALYNLQENGNTIEDVFKLMGRHENSSENGIVWAGYNNSNFDKPSLMQTFNSVKNTKYTRKGKKSFAKSQIDILAVISNTVENPYSTIGENLTLGQTSSSLGTRASAGDLHFSGYDVDMTTKVGNKYIPKIAKVGTGNKIENGQSFVAKKGFGPYGTKDTANKGQMSGIYRRNNESGKYESTRTYQERALQENKEYKLVGQYSDIYKEGSNSPMYGLEFVEQKTGHTSFIFNENINTINSIFDENLIPNNTLEAKERIKNGEKEVARRRYERLISGNTDDFQADSVVRLTSAYQDIDYLDVAGQSFKDKKDIIQEAIRLKNAEKGLKHPYDSSYQKMESMFDIKEKMQQERSFWEGIVIPRAQEEVAGKNLTKNESILQKNKIVKAYGDSLNQFAPNSQMSYGFSDMKKLPMTTANGISYLDMNNSGSISKKLSMINSNSKRPSEVRRDMYQFLDSFGSSSGIPDHQILKYKSQINGFLKDGPKGIPKTFLDEISAQMYENTEESRIIAQIPGLDIHAADTQSVRGSYLNSLTSNRTTSNKAHKEVVSIAESKIKEKYGIHSNSLELKNFFSHEEVGKYMKSSIEVERKLKENINYKGKVQKESLENKVQKLIKSYTDEGLGVSLVTDQSGITMFFGKESLGIENMNPLELHKAKNLNSVRLPLYTNDGLIDINGAKAVNMFEFDTRNGGSLKTTQDKAFQGLSDVPKKFNKQKRIQMAYEGKVDEISLFEKIIQSTSNSIIGSQEVADWKKGISEKTNTNSTLRNFYNGTIVNTKPYENEWVEKNFPDAFKQYNNYNQGNHNTSFFDSKVKLSKEVPSMREIKHEYARKYQKDFNETYGDTLGIQLSSFGNTNKHILSGKSRSVDPRILVPAGNYDPTHTETLVKSFNYYPQDMQHSNNQMELLGMSESQKRMAKETTRTPLGNNLLKEEQTGFNMEVGYMDDFNIKQKVDSAIKSNDNSMVLKQTELKAELAKDGSSRNKQVIERLEKEISVLDVKASQLKSMEAKSSFDGGLLISKDKLNLYSKVEQRTVKLGKDEFLNPEVLEVLKNNPAVQEALNGEFDGTQSFLLDKAIPSNSFNLDKDKQLTMGMINKYETIDGTPMSKTVAASKTKFHQDKWGVKGIKVDPKTGAVEVITENIQKIDGAGANKLLVGGQVRAAAFPVESELFSELFGTSDIIIPKTKASKESGAEIINGIITSQRNEVIKSLEEASVSGNTDSSMIKSFLQNNKTLTMGDLSKVEIQNQFLNEAFKPELSVLGIRNQVEIEANSTRLIYPHNIENPELLGAKGATNLDTFKKNISNKLGKEVNDSLVQEVRLHDVYEWAGVTTKLKSGEKLSSIMGSKYGKDSIIYEHYLGGKGKNSKKYWDAGMQILNSNEKMTGGILNPTKNNVILDLAASFASNADENIQIGENGEMILAIDGFKSLPDGRYDNKKSSMYDYKNTILDVKSLQVKDGNNVITIGDIMKDDIEKSVWAKLPKVEGMEHEYFPVIDMKISGMNDEDTAIFDSIISRQKDIFGDSMKLQKEVMDANLTPLENIEEKNRLIQNINNNVRNHKEEMSEFMTKTKGGFMDHIQKKEMPNSGFFNSAASNVANQYTKDASGAWANTGKFKDGIQYMNPIDFEKMLSPEVLPAMADDLGISYDVTVGGLMTKETQSSVKTQIKKSLNVETGDGELYSHSLRFPINQKQTVTTQKLRLSDDVAENTLITGLGAAELMKMDNDGDKVAIDLSLYGQNKENRKVILDSQKKEWTREQINIKEAAQKVMNDEEAKTVQGIGRSIELGYNNEEIANLLSPKTSTAHGIQSLEASLNATNIGPLDNLRQRYMIDYQLLQEAGHTSGQITKPQLDANTTRFESFISGISQDPISSKKMTMEALTKGKELTDEELIASTLHRQKSIDKIPYAMEKLGFNSKGDITGSENLKKVFSDAGLLVMGGDEEKAFMEVLPEIAKVNSAREILGNNRMFSSQGTTDINNVMDFISGENSSLQKVEILNRVSAERKASNSGIDSLSEKVLDSLSEVERVNKERLSKVFEEVNPIKVNEVLSEVPILEQMRESRGARETLSDGMDLLTDQKKKRIGAIHNTPENLVSGIKNLAEKARGSSAVAMGGMFAGAWAISSLMRKAPTPEGEIAQQEATQAQVNPSALLTSPTARVTNNNEMVTLNVQASGNSDMNHNAVASLINEQIGQMTGSPMEINMNVTDNTATLNKNWYDKKISSAFGLD